MKWGIEIQSCTKCGA